MSLLRFNATNTLGSGPAGFRSTPRRLSTTVRRSFNLRSCGSANIQVLDFPGDVTALTTLRQEFFGSGKSRRYRAFKQGNAVVVNCHVVGGCGGCRGELLITHK